MRLTRWQRRSRNQAVRPFSISAAASRSETPSGSLHDARCVHDAFVAYAPGVLPDVGDAIARPQLRDVLPGLEHDARGLAADAARECHRIEPAAVVGVDEVDADRGLADADLAAADRAGIDGLEAKDLGTAVLVDADRVRHVATIHDSPRGLK